MRAWLERTTTIGTTRVDQSDLKDGLVWFPLEIEFWTTLRNAAPNESLRSGYGLKQMLAEQKLGALNAMIHL